MSKQAATPDQTSAAKDFVLTSKKGWRRGVDWGSIFVGGIMGLLPSMAIGMPIIASSGTVVGIPVAVGIVVLAIVACEVGSRKDQARVFKILFEKENIPQQDGIADKIIAAMKPGIGTDQFIGVINNLLERKEISADLTELVNKPQISDAQERIRLHYINGYKEDRMGLSDKAVLQFLLLKSVVDKLNSNQELLPEVDRGILREKFAKFGGKFFQHCETRYPEKMTPECRKNISAVLSKYGYSNVQGAEVRDWASGASVVVEMAPVRLGVASARSDRDEGRSGGEGGGGSLVSARADRVEAMKGGAEKDGHG